MLPPQSKRAPGHIPGHQSGDAGSGSGSGSNRTIRTANQARNILQGGYSLAKESSAFGQEQYSPFHNSEALEAETLLRAAPLFQPPVTMTRGMFKGKTVRFSLEMAQEPIHGRRKTEKDRRALAHCPIARLRINQCERSLSGDSWIEEEYDLSTIESSYLVCAAELFSPNRESLDAPRASKAEADSPRTSNDGSGFDHILSSQSSPRSLYVPPTHVPYYDNGNRPSSSTQPWIVDPHAGPGPSSLRRGSFPSDQVDGDLRRSYHPDDGGQSAVERGKKRDRDLDYHTDILDPTQEPHGMPVHSDFVNPNSAPLAPSEWGSTRGRARRGTAGTSGSKNRDGSVGSSSTGRGKSRGSGRISKKIKAARMGLTRNLYGGLHVPAVKILSMEGAQGLWFLFTDLAVRLEGEYSLRFRCYDLTSVPPPGGQPSPGLVDCFSQTFNIYSPRNFPGLPKTTALAEHFARQGFKLNTRKSDRTAKAPFRKDGIEHGENDSEPDDPQSKSSPDRPLPTPLQSQKPGFRPGEKYRDTGGQNSGSTQTGGSSSTMGSNGLLTGSSTSGSYNESIRGTHSGSGYDV